MTAYRYISTIICPLGTKFIIFTSFNIFPHCQSVVECLDLKNSFEKLSIILFLLIRYSKNEKTLVKK